MKESEILNKVLEKENLRMSTLDMYDWMSVRICSILHNMKFLLQDLDDNSDNEHFLYHYVEAYNHMKNAENDLHNMYDANKWSIPKVTPLESRELRENYKSLIYIKQKMHDMMSYKMSKSIKPDKMAESFLTNLDKFEEEIYNVI